MPVHKVETPDGQIIKVEAPEGASQAEIIAFAEANYKPKEQKEETSTLRRLADQPINFAQGVVSGVRMISDSFGADNPISKNLRGVEDYVGSLLSAQAQDNQQEIARIMEEAKDKGVLDQVKKGVEAFMVAPADLMVQAFGTVIPNLVGGLAGRALGVSARVAGVGTGAAMGAGVTKGAIYDAVKEELAKTGMSKEQVEQRAILAQEYGGQNLDQILLGTALGGVAAGTGIERALLPGAVKNVMSKAAAKSAIARGVGTGFAEGTVEFGQGFQEPVAQNIALQREGFDVPTFQSAFASGTMESLAGAGLGAGVGALSRPQEAFTPTSEDARAQAPAVTPAAPSAPPAAPPATPYQPLSAEEARQQSIDQQLARQNAFQSQFEQPPVAGETPQQAYERQMAEQAQRPDARLFGATPQQPLLNEDQLAARRQQAQAQAEQDFGLGIGTPRPPVTPQDVQARQLAAQQEMDGDRFQQQTIPPAVTPAQAQPRQPAPIPSARAIDRQAELLGQRAGLPQIEQVDLEERADIAGGTGQVATPQTRFVDLTPMPPRLARQKLAALQANAPDADLNIVPHPEMSGRFAIEERVAAIEEAAEPRREDRPSVSFAQAMQMVSDVQRTGIITPEAIAAAQQYNLNIDPVLMQFAERTTPENLLVQQRRGMADEAALEAELRGGVATPEEAQRLRETGMGRPYDSIVAPRSEATVELGKGERQRRLEAEAIVEQDAKKAEFFQTLQGPELWLDGFELGVNPKSAIQTASPQFTEQFMKPEGRYSLVTTATPEAKVAAEKFVKEAMPMLKRFGLGKVGLRLVDSINNGTADGMYAQQIITLALDSDNPMGVMRHEAIHALKELGAFTPAEWKVLTKAAKDKWINQFFNRDMQDRYQQVYLEQNGNLDGFPEYLQEEAIAQAFRFFSETKPPSGMIANLMRRLNALFDALGNFFRGQGFQNIDEMFLPNRILADIERGAIQPGRAQGRTEEVPKFSLRSHAVDIVSNKVKKPKIEGKVTVDKVGQYFDNKVMEKFGRKLDYKNPEDFALALKQAQAEIKFQLEQENSGLNWYEEDVKTAFEYTERVIPELASEQNRLLFSVMAGIMSPQTNARDNWFIAAKAFQHYVATNTIPGNNPETGGLWQGGTQSANKKVQLEFLNKMVANLGKLPTLEWLVGQHPVKDVNQFRLQYGNVKSGIGGKATDQVIGLYAFGPKVGPFVSNLNGIYDVTVDKWMTRTFNRYFGTMVDANGKIIDAPTEPQRKAVKQLVNEAAQNANIKPYQVQSLLWFFEQRLFRELGTPAPSYGFSDGGRKFFESASRGDETSGRNAAAKAKKQPDPKFSLRDFGLDQSAVRPGAQSDGAGRDGRASNQGGSSAPLAGAPSFQGASGPDQRLVQVAKNYAESKGLPFGRQSAYVDIDPTFSKRVADAYESMRDDPLNPDVIEAYQDLIQQVMDQYNALVDAGYQFTFFDSNTDPYGGNPVNAMRDLRNNKTMAVYGTYDGFGQTEISPSDVKRNPMLASTGLRWVDQQGFARPVLANDLFRAVHDAFGHGLEGAGFRARGEENAFQAHAKLFTGKALGALASETRGQNSWLNFGPFGEQNQNAKVEDTVFAEQKVGLMPSWTWTENIVPDAKFSLRSDQSALRPSPSSDAGISFNPVKEDAVAYQGSHYGKARTDVLNGAKYGQGLRGAEARRLERSDDDRIKRRVYFYIPRSNDTMPNREAGVGGYVYTQKLDNILAPGATMSRLTREAAGDANRFESLVVDNGYDGYAVPDYGMMVVMNQDVPVKYEGTVDEVHGGKKPQQKFSLRAPKTPEFKQFFGNSKIVNPDGTPKVMYHGTARDIFEFIPKQANAIFVTESPEFAEIFTNESAQYMVQEQIKSIQAMFQDMSPQDQLELMKNGYKLAVKEKFLSKAAVKEEIAELTDMVNQGLSLTNEFGRVAESFAPSIERSLASGRNIMPLYVRAENPFDYENPAHLAELTQELNKRSTQYGQLLGDNLIPWIKTGNWENIEKSQVQDAIKALGHDGFYVKERNEKNLAVYNPAQIKSATGNRGTFDPNNPDIRYSLKNAPPNRYTKLAPDDPSTGKAVIKAAESAFNAVKNDGSRTSARINLIDRFSGLSRTLESLPLFSDGQLRADMLHHSKAQGINLIKGGLLTGTPFLNADGTIGIERSENNLARAAYLADRLNTNKNVVESGLSGRAMVAEVARILRGADILAEDAELRKLGERQILEAKKMSDELKKLVQQGVSSPKSVAEAKKAIDNMRRIGNENRKMNRELQVKPEDIAWAKKQLDLIPEVKEVLDIWKAVNTSLVTLWEDTGLLDKETADKYRAAKNYVPLFKSREDLNEESFFKTGSGAKTTAKIKALEGADISRNIWENIDKQYATMTAAAYENQTRRVSVDQMRSISTDLAEITNASDPRVNLRYRDNGKDVHVVIENPNDLAAFQSMSYQLSPIMKFLGGFTNVLRAGALLNPMFWIRQLIRDPIHATIAGQSGIVTPVHSAAEFLRIITQNSEEARVLASRGVIGQFDSTVTLNEFLGNVGKDKQQPPGAIQKGLHKLMQIHEASDAATRVAIFKKAKAKALKDGMSEPQAVDYAVFKARESINFALTGNSPTLANARQMIPFLNATIVGLDTLYRAATGYGLNAEEKAKAKSMFRNRAMMLTAMSLAYAMSMQDDEDYQKLPDYVKDGNWLVPMSTETGKTFVKVSVPYEVGFLFKTLPEIFVRYLAGTSTGKESLSALRAGFIHNMPTGGVPIPQFAKPVLEVVTNHSFFTNRPIEGMGDSRLPVAHRGQKASEFAKMMSGLGLAEIGMSPAKIDVLTKGYFAEFGAFFNELTDALLSVGSGQQKTPRNIENQPFMKAFLTDPQVNKAISDFYDIEKNATETANLFSKYKNEGQGDMLSEMVADPDKLKQVGGAPVLRKISSAMSDIQKAIRTIDKNQSMPPEERRERINELQKQIGILAEQGKQVADSIGLRR